MANIRISQRSEFECSYIFVNRSNDRIWNSHHYKIEVTVSGPQNTHDNDTIVEFNVLKSRIDSILPNNRFIYDKNGLVDILLVAQAINSCGIQSVGYNFSPSAENLVEYFAKELQSKLNVTYKGVIVEEIKLRETPNSVAIWANPHIDD